MHVAVITSYFPSLSQTFVLNQITSLIDAGHEVTIIASGPADTETVHADVERYGLVERTIYWGDEGRISLPGLATELRASWKGRRALGLQGGRSVLTRLKRAKSLRNTPEFDAILCHFGTLARECQVLREIGALRGPLITIFHGYDMSSTLVREGEDFYDDLLRRGELFLPISQFWRARLIKMGADKGRTLVHHMGVDPSRFEFRPRSPGDDGRIGILSIGRFVEKKGFAQGLRAFAKIVDDFPGARYTIIGDGELRSEYEEIIAKFGLEDRVDLPGWARRDEVQEQLYAHQVLMVPSLTGPDGDMEGIPVVLMEGMATGIPVITTNHSGIPELVTHGESGHLAEEGDVDGLARELKEILASPEKWGELGEAARRTVEEEFSLHDLNRRLVGLLEDQVWNEE